MSIPKTNGKTTMTTVLSIIIMEGFLLAVEVPLEEDFPLEDFLLADLMCILDVLLKASNKNTNDNHNRKMLMKMNRYNSIETPVNNQKQKLVKTWSTQSLL
jgi:hypothetical protein